MNNKDKHVPKGLGGLIDVQKEQDKQLQKITDDNNVVLLAFIGSYVPLRYNPVRSGSTSINIVDEFGME